MEWITAPNNYILNDDDISCFIAGGITDCNDWQKEVKDILIGLDKIFESDKTRLICFNPRQANFDITNPNASTEQITWEFNHLSEMDIFSMYFANSNNSNQPICLYELGRYLAEMKRRFPADYLKRIIITVEDGYSRTQDVIIQSKLALGKDIVICHGNCRQHAVNIHNAYYILQNSR